MRVISKSKELFKFSKNESLIIYGIAILMMLYHHCFCIPERIHNNFIPTFGVRSWDVAGAIFCNLCVAIYTFISGYGMTIGAMNSGMMGRHVLRRLISFYGKFWIVFLVFIPIGVLWYEVVIDSWTPLIGALFGYKCSRYCYVWWYVSFYLRLIIIYPVIYFCLRIAERIPFLYLVYLGGVVAVYELDCFVSIKTNLQNGSLCYYLTFLIGVLVAKYSIFNRLYMIFKKVNAIRSKIWMISLLCLFLCFVIRIVLSKYGMAHRFDFIIAPLFVFCCLCLIQDIQSNFVIKSLKFFGRLSVFMWLTHAFFIYFYFQEFILYPRYAPLIFIWLVFVTATVSFCLNWIYEHILLLLSDKKSMRLN